MSQRNATVRILIWYYSRHGATQQLADAIARGVLSADGEPILRSVTVSGDAACQRDLPLEADDFRDCDGVLLGSPTRFGHMASALQQAFEQHSGSWLAGHLVGKPAAVFTSSSSMHGGQETTLLSLAVPLLHHGMLLLGLPYSEPALHHTQGGGSPYGASHVSHDSQGHLRADETTLAEALGRRVTRYAQVVKGVNL